MVYHYSDGIHVISIACQATHFFKEKFPGVGPKVKAYTIEVARAMPSDQYLFQTVDEEVTFGEQMVHIINNIVYLGQKIYETDHSRFEPFDASKPDEDQITDALSMTVDYVAGNIASFPEARLS